MKAPTLETIILVVIILIVAIVVAGTFVSIKNEMICEQNNGVYVQTSMQFKCIKAETLTISEQK